MSLKIFTIKRTVGFFIFLALLGSSLLLTHVLSPREKTEISTDSMPGDEAQGGITKGNNTSSTPHHLKTDSSVTYESAVLESTKPQANAAILHWEQQDNPGEVVAGFRTFNGEAWSDWVESSPAVDRKDGTSIPHAALVLADRIHKIQYRFELFADDTTHASPDIDLASPTIELVDTTKGPSPTKGKSLVSRALETLGFFKKVEAHSDAPRIYTRAEWGSPEPESSDGWTPEYLPIERVIVHHTAVAAQSDSAAAVRAIWHYHANSLGWGDIGYNYLVDSSGNIFQGRYFDANYAEETSTDVVGGHAYSYNYGSTGIAALGDFSKSQPSEAMLNSIANLAAFKLYRYGMHPSTWHEGLPVMIGHRDVIQTSCPSNIHQHLPTIRTLAATEYDHYANQPFTTSDYDVVKAMNSPTVYVVLGNELRTIGSTGQRDCFIMAYKGRMRSVTSGNIASMTVGSAAPACSPPDFTWYYPEGQHQQYVTLYGGLYTVGPADVQELDGINRARPLSQEGIEYLEDNYEAPSIPGHILVKGVGQPTVYEANGDTLYQVPDPDTRDCLVAQHGSVKNVPASLISSYQFRSKISGTLATCSLTDGTLIMNPNGITIAQISSTNRKPVVHPAVRDCIKGRTGVGEPYKVAQSAWDGYTDGSNAYCPYGSTIRFVKEAGSPTVWRVFTDGRKQHADGFCVVDPWTTVNDKYRVWTVPDGETAGHANDGVFSATAGNCAAIT